METDSAVARQTWISGGQFDDIDAQAAHLHGYGQQYQQLSRGPFEGRYRSFAFGDDLGIHLEVANRALAQSASIATGRYAACLLVETSPPCAINADLFSLNHVALCPENKVLEGKTPAGMSICCMDVSRELLPDDAESLRAARILNDPARSGQLRELVRSGLSAFSALESPSCYPAAVKSFKSSLGDLLWQVATQSQDKDVVRPHHYAGARTLLVFRRARDYIHHNLADGISIVALCKDVGSSRRSLESVFQSVIGMGPGNYVRTLQLNQIRRDLISEASAGVSIGVIAARRGIWHWSRFSRHYRLLFGELPSQTRLRHGIQHRPATGTSQVSIRRLA
jgi:AraC family ethanolamine operon transcriptional activator